MDKIKKSKEILISSLIAAAAVLVYFAAKKIYPFGNGSFDISGITLPAYLRVWDILHQKASPFFDWYTGGGTSAESSLSGFLISPYSLLLLFVKRSGVQAALVFLFVLKTALAAAAMCFYMKKTYKNSFAANISIPAIYAATMLILQYYTNIMFLEAAALYPLIIYAIRLMGKNGKVWTYLISIASALLISADTWLFILPVSIIYAVVFMHRISETQSRKKFAANFMLYTTAAALLSAVCFYPKISDGIIKYSPQKSNIMTVDLSEPTDKISRVKIFDADLPLNGGDALQKPVLTTQKSKNNIGYIDQMQKFGYGFDKNSLLYTGGTIFSDAFLNVTNAVSKSEADPELYNKIDELNGYGIYESRYKFPFGMLMGMNFFVTSFPAEGIKMQNLLYNNLSGTFDQLMEDAKELANAKANDTTLNIPIEGERSLYALAKGTEKAQYTLCLNGKEYTVCNGNGFVELGTYKNKKLKLEIKADGSDIENLEIGVLDNKKLADLANKLAARHAENINIKNSEMSMTAEMPIDGMIFLPVKFDLNWEATANGAPADIMPVLNNGFMGVIVNKGHNDVTLKYVPKRFYTGATFSLFGIMLALWAAERRREKLDWADSKILQNISYVFIYIAAAAAIIGLCFFIFILI